MTRLTHSQWTCIHHLSLEMHLLRTEQELIDFVLLRFPEALEIKQIVWHKRSRSEEISQEHAHLTGAYRDAMHKSKRALSETIATNPVILSLEISDEIALPKDAGVAMIDFASMHDIKETGDYRDFNQHVDNADHAAVEF